MQFHPVLHSMCFLVSATTADGVGNLGAEQNHISVPVADHGAWATAMNNLGIMPMGISGQQLVSGTFYSQLYKIYFTGNHRWLIILNIFVVCKLFI